MRKFAIVTDSCSEFDKPLREKYGVNVEGEGESDPQSRGGTNTADDVVTVNYGYFRNEKGGIGRQGRFRKEESIRVV